ncbi:MAG: ATPase [Flavobacteriaceae bacterium]|nr:ATPase [Flavobacteriaceae bacterium]|tara:strand:+ start:83020 stop:83556 length:537 start_codon:yes stop_codon:yes gene_type:complete
MQQKIVFFGGPGTGKTTIINELKKLGYPCLDEISREITAKAQKEGISQLFLEDPLLFSSKLLEGREMQFKSANELNEPVVFFDRGLPEVFGYMDYLGTEYPDRFVEKSKAYRYQKVIHFPVWEKIYTTDDERYESLVEAQKIEKYLIDAYESLGYTVHSIPFGSIEQRTRYILNLIND